MRQRLRREGETGRMLLCKPQTEKKGPFATAMPGEISSPADDRGKRPMEKGAMSIKGKKAPVSTRWADDACQR